MNKLLENLTKEKYNIVLLGDFNINLLSYDSSLDISSFLNNMCSNALFPFVTQPTRVTSKSKTLIDNIFINFHSQDIILGNLTISISDHMSQFIQIPSRSQKRSVTKQRPIKGAIRISKMLILLRILKILIGRIS